DPNGAGTLAWVQMLISASGASTNACYVHYGLASNTFFLFNNQVSGGGSVAPGPGSTSNSQCTLRGTGSRATLSGTDLTLDVDLVFSSGFGGTKNVYMYGMDGSANGTGWVQKGTWTVP